MQLFGDNGIITQAQNATYMQGIAALEEYLQTEYVKYYDEADDYTNKIEMLSSKMTNLCLKDGTKNYITYDGKMYYLVNKQALPDDIKNQLKGGDTTEYIEYIRLIDVYGITEDLRVYYCADGLEGALGTVGDLEVDPSTPLVKVNNDGEMKSALTEALAEIGIEVGEEGITVGDIVSLKDFELDGSKYNITSLSALSELTSLQTLTLKNVNVSNLDGIESCSLLYYIYLKDCKIGDYSKLSTVLDLKYLYIYLSPSINETDANAQITNLGNGLANATNLNELEYFGISGVTDFYEDSYSFIIGVGNGNSKYYFFNNSRSNVTDISSLSKFAQNIKSSIKYMYLNNNKISSIEVLEGFSNIYELDLMCNSTLSNLKGLENHPSIVYLTVHNCNLTDISGLQGTIGLKYFTLHTNSNLSNLNGLEQSMSLDTMLAYSCNIIDITALVNHTNLKYLSLYSNVNLENVITLGTLTGLNNLYLANNEKMIGIEVRDALADPTTHILQNCGGNYSIPSKYNIYFATLTSYDYSNMNLTDDSDEINALKGRTNVTRLNLSGNAQLSNEKLQEILSTMTGLKALSLKGLQLENLDFMNNVTGLVELDIRNCNNISSDLSILNTKGTNLKNFVTNNNNIDLTKIQTAINNISNQPGTIIEESWIHKYDWSCRGFITVGEGFNFEDCTDITNYKCIGSSIGGIRNGIVDLSNSKIIKIIIRNEGSRKYILPSTINEAIIRGGFNVDLSLCIDLTQLTLDEINENDTKQILSTLSENNVLKEISIVRYRSDNLNFLSSFNTSKLIKLSITGNTRNYPLDSSERAYITSLKGIENAPNLTNVDFRTTRLNDISDIKNCTKLTSVSIWDNPVLQSLSGLEACTELKILNGYNSSIGNIEALRNCTKLETINLYNNKISSISALSNLKNISTLTLNDNNISDLSPLESLIENGKIKFTSLNLSNNLLQTTTVGGHNNIDTLTKLFNAGLRSLNISGNNFTPSSTDSLKSLGWTSYTE